MFWFCTLDDFEGFLYLYFGVDVFELDLFNEVVMVLDCWILDKVHRLSYLLLVFSDCFNSLLQIRVYQVSCDIDVESSWLYVLCVCACLQQSQSKGFGAVWKDEYLCYLWFSSTQAQQQSMLFWQAGSRQTMLRTSPKWYPCFWHGRYYTLGTACISISIRIWSLFNIS